MSELTNVQVPTLALPVDPTGAYKDIVFVRGFEAYYQLAGGINLPKIVFCKCSDGVVRRQLVKGRDDLRQDAAMQQVRGPRCAESRLLRITARKLPRGAARRLQRGAIKCEKIALSSFAL